MHICRSITGDNRIYPTFQQTIKPHTQTFNVHVSSHTCILKGFFVEQL